MKSLIVMVSGVLNGASSSGVGIIFSSHSDRLYVATANHVVRRYNNGENTEISDLKVEFGFLPGEKFEAKLLSNEDDILDLAILVVTGVSGKSIPVQQIAFAHLGTIAQLQRGDDVFMMGMKWRTPVSAGKVSVIEDPEIQFEGSSVQPGDSGGGLFTSNWQLVGMLVRRGQAEGTAVAIDRILNRLSVWGYSVDLSQASLPASPTPAPAPSPSPAPTPTITYPSPDSTSPIQIAVAGPMTGQFAAFGEQLRRGAEMAVKDINAHGGVLGRKVSLMVGDDQCDPKQAVAVANNMIARHIVLMAGHFCSGSSIPASAVYAEEGVLQITPASTNPLLTDSAAANGWTTVMRTTGRDDAQGGFAGAWLAKNYAGKKVAIIDDGSKYGKGVADETRKRMNAAGLKEVLNEKFTSGETNFSVLISKLKAADIDVVYVGGYHPEAALIVRQARERGLAADLVSDDALNTSEFWTISGPAGVGVRFSDAASSIDLPSARKVVEEFRKDKYEPEGYTLPTYAAIQAWSEAANKVQSTDGVRVAQALRRFGAHTVIGDLRWNEKGDIVDPNYSWFVWTTNGNYTEEK